jgi:SHS family lactate transporter-like MFS transporter
MPGAAANVVAAAPVVPIAETFHVPLVEVAAVFTITLWLRLVGAVGSGWAI